jgi:hypothetical protein
MAYTSSGRLPIERASKLGHVKIIQDPQIQRLLEAFEQIEPAQEGAFGECTGTLDLGMTHHLENIVAVDGSHVAIPNVIHQYKRIAFITAGVVVLRRSDLAAMKFSPIVDPRDLSEHLRNSTEVKVAALPLSGVAIPGETVVESIRRLIEQTLRTNDLYETLRFLIYREWLPNYEEKAYMECLSDGCGHDIFLPRSATRFACPGCGRSYTLADYLQVVQGPPDDWATEEVASHVRNIMETLLLMRLIRWSSEHPPVLTRTLFVKDGPLLLRAQLYRLAEAIRDYLAYLHEQGHSVHLVGVEKTGDLVNHLPLLASVLQKPGDYFLPTVRYLHERISGVPFVPSSYRNRVQYGVKVVVRLGIQHVIVFQVPTGAFLTEPRVEDLYGFPASMGLLSEMLSSAYENALIPLVLANQVASISLKPSGDILDAFASRMLEGRG